MERKPNQLSGGQKQRVALGRLLIRNPSIHLFDEPLSNLDANLRTDMRKELAELHKEYNKTSLFVTHDQIEAMTLGQRICVMNHGKVMQIGTPEEIYQNQLIDLLLNSLVFQPLTYSRVHSRKRKVFLKSMSQQEYPYLLRLKT